MIDDTIFRNFGTAAPAPMFDAELGVIFLRMRTLIGISLWDLARALDAEPTVIANLEAGAIDALPPWPELKRIVESYAALTGIEASPILSRLSYSHLQAMAPSRGGAVQDPHARGDNVENWEAQAQAHFVQRPVSRAHQTDMRGAAAQATDAAYQARYAPTDEIPSRAVTTVRGFRQRSAATAVRHVPVEAEGEIAAGPTRKMPLLGGLEHILRAHKLAIGAIIGVAVPVMLLLTARVSPGMLYGLANPLPAAIGAPLRRGIDQVVSGMAPLRDGLTWIDVGDPQLRKSDKLPGTAP